MSNTQESLKVFSAMQEGKPLATYRKTILGRVAITILDPFTDKPTGIILTGTATSEDAKIDVWTVREELFLKRMNRSHFETGILKKVETPVAEEKDKVAPVYSDEELEDILKLAYISLQKQLVEIEDPAILNRLVEKAKELEKTPKVIEVINNRLQVVLSVEG